MVLDFALGTGYQYGLLRIAVTVVFADVANVPDYRFDVKAMAVTLTAQKLTIMIPIIL